jgi:hypothetical protein
MEDLAGPSGSVPGAFNKIEPTETAPGASETVKILETTETTPGADETVKI